MFKPCSDLLWGFAGRNVEQVTGRQENRKKLTAKRVKITVELMAFLVKRKTLKFFNVEVDQVFHLRLRRKHRCFDVVHRTRLRFVFLIRKNSRIFSSHWESLESAVVAVFNNWRWVMLITQSESNIELFRAWRYSAVSDDMERITFLRICRLNVTISDLELWEARALSQGNCFVDKYSQHEDDR